MFEVNDYVFYGSGGVCRVVDIKTAPLENMPKDREYYILRSMHDASGVAYIPIDSDGVFLRPLITREDAEDLLARCEQIECIDEPVAKQLRERYIEAMRTHRPEEWVRVIKTVNRRLRAPRPAARRISETERSLAENARRYLYTELSLVMEQSVAEVEARLKALLCAE